MELLTVLNARSIWHFDLKHLNPTGKNIDQELIQWLRASYHFREFPSSDVLRSENPQGIVFGGGTYESPDAPPEELEKYYVDLTIFNDGLVGNTRHSTKKTDEFLFDVLTRAAVEFKLEFGPKLIQRKLYVSELEVRSIRELRFFTPELEDFAAKISSAYPSGPMTFQLASLGFWPDLSIERWRPSPFQIEKRLGAPSEDIYYSRAPHHTEDHLKLLEDLEEIMIHNAMTVVGDYPPKD